MMCDETTTPLFIIETSVHFNGEKLDLYDVLYNPLYLHWRNEIYHLMDIS